MSNNNELSRRVIYFLELNVMASLNYNSNHLVERILTGVICIEFCAFRSGGSTVGAERSRACLLNRHLFCAYENLVCCLRATGCAVSAEILAGPAVPA